MSLPPLDLLDPGAAPRYGGDPASIARLIERAAGEHGVDVRVEDWQAGPQATRFLLTPGVGVLPKRIEALTDALTVKLGAPVRYAGPRGTAVGVEVPNLGDRDPVRLRYLLGDAPQAFGMAVVGLGIDSAVVTARLSKLPHLLIGGATGQGKSVLMNAVLISLLMHAPPAELRLTLIDPKRVELKAYERLPHLARPIVTDVADAAEALRDAVREMDFRYQRMEARGVKNIDGWNELENNARWPRQVIVIDELADLMMTGGKDVEAAIVRLAQLGRAAGYHLILATQYPSAKVITPLIKQNVPSRVALTTADHTASNLIIGASGAEKLAGAGDALWSPVGALEPVRLQGAYVSDDEVARVVAWWVEEDRPRREADAAFARLKAAREAEAARKAAEAGENEAAARVAATARAREVLGGDAAAEEAPLRIDPQDAARLELAESMSLERSRLVKRVDELEHAMGLMGRTLAAVAAALGFEVPDE